MSENATLAILQTSSSFSTHLDSKLGAVLIGLIVIAILFGVSNVQTLGYYTRSACDTRYMKYTVAFLWCLDALHLALISHFVYFYLVTNFTNLSVITQLTWSFCLHIIVTTTIDFTVRVYYTRRVWIMSHKNWYLTAVPAALNLVHLACGLVLTAKIFSYHSMHQLGRISWVFYTGLCSTIAADLWVASTLCYFLGKNKTGFESTDTIINVLMMYIINSGLLTSLCAIFCLITYSVMPTNLIFVAFFFCLPKLYFNSMLATINSRDKRRNLLGRHTNSEGPGPLQRVVNVSMGPNAYNNITSFGTIDGAPYSSTRPDFSFGEKESHGLAVSVQTETIYHSDNVEA